VLNSVIAFAIENKLRWITIQAASSCPEQYKMKYPFQVTYGWLWVL